MIFHHLLRAWLRQFHAHGGLDHLRSPVLEACDRDPRPHAIPVPTYKPSVAPQVEIDSSRLIWPCPPLARLAVLQRRAAGFGRLAN